MDAFARIELAEVISTIIYVIIGGGLLGLCWLIVEWITPFSLRKEIEQDQNMALAVLMGSVFISLAIIISAVIRS